MRVCHFVASTGLGRGDAFVDLVNVLADDMEIVLLCPKGSKFLPALSSGITVLEYGSANTRLNPFLLLELCGLLRRVKADIVHTHFAKATEIYHLLHRFVGACHVATKHNPRKGKIFNRIDHVIAVSAGVAASISHPRVEVIYNGIRPVTVERHARNDVFRICAVGRLDKIKGFDNLIREVAKLPFDYRLEIAGDGEERTALQELVASLNLQEKVSLLGFRTDIPQILANADLQVISSFSEGFSLAMVEGIFYSDLLISTDVAGANEILDKRLMIPGREIADKIADIYADYQLYKGFFAETKRKFEKKLDIGHTAKLYAEYYRKIAAQEL